MNPVDFSLAVTTDRRGSIRTIEQQGGVATDWAAGGRGLVLVVSPDCANAWGPTATQAHTFRVANNRREVTRIGIRSLVAWFTARKLGISDHTAVLRVSNAI